MDANNLSIKIAATALMLNEKKVVDFYPVWLNMTEI
jgi:hypothetical protein